MTDKKTETSQEERTRSQAPVLTTPASKRVPPETNQKAGSARSVLAPAALVVALGALGLSASLYMRNQQLVESHAELTARLTASQNDTQRVGSQISGAVSRLETHEQRLDALQTQLADASAIINDLDEALRSMTDRGSELVLLNDIDHLATIAQQQLQLGGNVRNAIVALESAQAQLARANRPALASLLQTVNGDLDRLRAASTIDIAAFSSQLEELAMLLTEAPLIMPDESGRMGARPEDTAQREQPAPTVPPATQGAEAAWWERAIDTTREWSRQAWDSVRTDLGQFIDVRRVDDASALLMSPDQATRFRESLRTRIMTAQLALMMRQPQVWKTETEAIVKAIETRYDESSPLTRKALRMARGMADATIDARLPTVDNTLQALNALREEQAQRFHGGEPADADALPPDAPHTHEPEADAPDTPGDAPAMNGTEPAHPADPPSSNSPAAQDSHAGSQGESAQSAPATDAGAAQTPAADAPSAIEAAAQSAGTTEG